MPEPTQQAGYSQSKPAFHSKPSEKLNYIYTSFSRSEPSSLWRRLTPRAPNVESRSKRVATLFWWRWELLCWILSLLMLVGIIITLYMFKGHSIPNWPYGISINTIVAILVAFETVLVEIPIAAAIGQLRWNWFKSDRPLSDFLRIGEASEGAFGSAKLLVHRRGGVLSQCGAILMICILAVAPLLQQIISYQDVTVEHGDASLSVALKFVGSGTEGIPSNEFSNAVFDGLSIPKPSKIESNGYRTCSTGNCTWPEYQSLAICSSCRYLNSASDQADDSLNELATPEPISAQNISVRSPLCKEPFMRFKKLNRPDLLSIEDKNVLFQGVIHSTGDTERSIKGAVQTCALYFCVSTFSAKEVNGKFETTRVDSYLHSRKRTYDLGKGVTGPYQEFNPPNSTEKFVVLDFERRLVSGYLKYRTTGFIRPCNAFGRMTNIHSFGIPFNNFDWPLKEVVLFDNDFLGITKNLHSHIGDIANGGVAPIFENVARRLTTVIQDPTANDGFLQNGVDRPGVLSSHNPVTKNVIGQAWKTTTVIDVRWGWLALPAALEVLAFCFVLFVLKHTHSIDEIMPWRPGAIEMLTCGPEEAIRKEASHSQNAEELEEFSHSVVVRLENSDSGWRLVRADGGG